MRVFVRAARGMFNPKNLLLVVAGMAAIAQTGISGSDQAVALAGQPTSRTASILRRRGRSSTTSSVCPEGHAA
jgi:hypothetical protein